MLHFLNESIIQKCSGIKFNSLDVIIVNTGLLHLAIDITFGFLVSSSQQENYHLLSQYLNSNKGLHFNKSKTTAWNFLKVIFEQMVKLLFHGYRFSDLKVIPTRTI